MSKGKLIVLEGIDGSGKSAQYRRLCDRMEKNNIDYNHIVFPRYDKDSSALIRMYLSGQFGSRPGDVNPYAASTFYAVDRFASYREDWGKVYESGGLILSDRYTTSNAVHQGSKLPEAELPGFANFTPEEYAEYVSGPDKLLFESVMYGPVRTADGELGLSLVPFCVSYFDRESGVSALAAMLERLGLDADEAERTAELGLEASDSLMYAYYSGGSVTLTLEEISELYPECRMAETFSSYGFPLDTELKTGGDWLEVYNGMFEGGDLELLRSLTAVRYLNATMDLLDSESAELRGSLSGAGTVSFADEDDALNLCGTYFPYITTGLYYDNLVSDEARSAVETVVVDILDAYRGMIADCAWMSDGTKAAALEKLDKMLYSVAESDFGRGLHGCDPSSADNLVELVMMGDRMTTLAYAENVEQPFDPQSLANTMFCDFNAAYYPTCNAFVIYGGILQMVDPSDTETTMATVGDVVAHEISHAFDTTGRFYDSDGEMTDWWTEDDDAVYSARTDALKEAMSSVEVLPDSYLDGDLVIGEAVADLCAMQCLMRIAADTEGFDYGRFFTALADMWCIKYSLEEAEERLATDPHPPGYLRVNVILQQIPEFHGWLGTSEGDGMWVPPEDRISVW